MISKNQTLILIIVFLLVYMVWHFIPSAWVMNGVHNYMTWGDTEPPRYFQSLSVVRIVAERTGSCGHYANLLAALLTVKLENVWIVDLVNCDDPPCGHTLVWSNGIYLDPSNNKVYNNVSWFRHDGEVWTSMQTGSIWRNVTTTNITYLDSKMTKEVN